jgi:hypothetical protein
MKLNRMHLLIGLAALLAVPATYAQNTACKSVEFSGAVLERFPNAPQGCLDVVERDGQKFAVYKADLVRISGKTAFLKFKLPDGTRSTTRAIKTDPARRVLIQGKPTRVQDLAVGQELTLYVKVSEPVLALAPASETEPLDLQPLADEKTQVASADTEQTTMPGTASGTYTFGLAGLLLLALASMFAFLRRFPRHRMK